MRFLQRRKLQDIEGKVSVIKLFKYSDWIDVILVLVGLISSLGNGVMQPLMMLLMGDMVNSYIYTPGDNTIIDEEVNHIIFNWIKESVNKVVVKMVYFWSDKYSVEFSENIFIVCSFSKRRN